jgi:DHA1 family bicyclomycin/chloramphenicol resistance-like MFS transporter
MKPQTPKAGSLGLILFVGGLVAVGPLSTDMYVPALPAIRVGFGSTVTVVQLSFSLFLAGFALGQLIVGPLSDRFGRRPVLAAGMALYAVTSLAASLSPSVEWLIVLRFFQALGAASAWVLNRAIVRDLHAPEETTRILGYVSAMMGGISTVVPLLGGVITETFGWRGIFYFITAFGAIYYIVILVWFGETTERNPDAIRPLSMARNIGLLLTNRVFSGYMACLCLTLGGIFTFIAGGSLVFIDGEGLSPGEFGALFIAMAPAFSLSSFLSGRAVRRFGTQTLFAIGVGSTLAGVGTLFVLAAIDNLTLYGVVPALMATAFGVGFIMPLCFSGALAPYPRIAGTASSLIGAGQAGFSALMGLVVAAIFDGTGLPVMAMMLTLMILSTLTYVFYLRPVMNRPPAATG